LLTAGLDGGLRGQARRMHERGPHVQGLLRGLSRAGVQAECPSCGHVEWAPTEDTGKRRGASDRMVSLACKHCGFIRLHLPGWHHGE
jgi:hypothetical protein